MVRQVHRLKDKVPSIIQLKAYLIDEFNDDIPTTLDFELGWFEGSCKKWLVVPEDLTQMYAKSVGSEISLWCDVSPSRKRKQNESSSSRKENGDDVESIYQVLLDEHGDKYDKPQLKLWARMLHCGSHTDFVKPPRVPLITGILDLLLNVTNLIFLTHLEILLPKLWLKQSALHLLLLDPEILKLKLTLLEFLQARLWICAARIYNSCVISSSSMRTTYFPLKSLLNKKE